jgi:hypothetical protein
MATITEQLAEAKETIKAKDGEIKTFSDSLTKAEGVVTKLTQENEALAGEVKTLTDLKSSGEKMLADVNAKLSDSVKEVERLKAEAKTADELALEKLAKIGHPAVDAKGTPETPDSEAVLKQYHDLQRTQGQKAADEFYNKNRAILCPPTMQARKVGA